MVMEEMKKSCNCLSQGEMTWICDALKSQSWLMEREIKWQNIWWKKEENTKNYNTNATIFKEKH